ncbi:MAG: transglycosylase SLT domain-containing protein, partial [bacterium]
ARAVGPWQFIKGTALKYGLKVNFWVDERRDPVKSTHAASRYLGELYERFESWALAMAAYNAGEGKIERALRKSKADDYWPLLRTRYLRSETKNYVAKFIAARQIASDPEGYGFSEIEYHSPFEFDEVEVPSPIDLEVVATAAGTTYDVIKELNPELRAWCTPLGASTYVVRIPKGTTETFLANLNAIPEEERLTLKQYTVKRGDTLVKIAKAEGVPMEVLLAINGLKKSGPVSLGTVLYLPPKDKIKLCSDIVKSQKTYHKKKNKRSKKLVT